MNEAKLKRCYLELRQGMFGAAYYQDADAYERCMEQGSGDPYRDLEEIERLAEERFVELPEV